MSTTSRRLLGSSSEGPEGTKVVQVRCQRTTLDRPLDYLVPEGFAAIAIGDLVSVELRGRKVEAWVVSTNPLEDATRKLQPLLRWLGRAVTPEAIALCEWAAWRWHSRVNRFLKTASPSRRVREMPHPPKSACALDPTKVWLGAGRDAVTSGGGLFVLAPTKDPFEILLGVIAELEAQEGTVLVIVPELGWAQRLVKRLGSIGVAAVSSTQDAQARAGWPVVVGTRAAIFLPVPKLSGVVIFDAHDESLGEEGAPSWNALEVARHRCAQWGSPLVATAPFRASSLRELSLLESPKDEEHLSWADIAVFDQRSLDPREGMFSSPLASAAAQVLETSDAQETAVVAVLNTKGRVVLLACSACRSVARCVSCGGAMALVDGVLVCRRCDAVRPVACASCGSTLLKGIRLGVQGAGEQFGALLRKPVEVVEGSGASDWTPSQVVLGTEAVLHRVRRAGLVAFLDFDQHLHAVRISASEDALALLVRALRMVALRPGGKVLVQTRDPEHPILLALGTGSVAQLLDDEDALRRSLKLPPYVAQAVLRGEGARALAQELGAVEISAGNFLIEAENHALLCDQLAALEIPDGVKVAVDARSA